MNVLELGRLLPEPQLQRLIILQAAVEMGNSCDAPVFQQAVECHRASLLVVDVLLHASPSI